MPDLTSDDARAERKAWIEKIKRVDMGVENGRTSAMDVVREFARFAVARCSRYGLPKGRG